MLLADATSATGGGKAGALGALLRAGLPVPDGFVVPFETYRDAVRALRPSPPASGPDDEARRALGTAPLRPAALDLLARGLERLGDPPVAVRSSASGEDTTHASAAGQHESVLAVRGVDAVANAVRVCWASLHSARAREYRRTTDPAPSGAEPVMAVLVQRLVDADASGVLFTPEPGGGPTRVEAAWGLGLGVVGGTVTPDAYDVDPDGSITRTVADKPTRLDRLGARLVAGAVPAGRRREPVLDDETLVRLVRLGHAATAVLGGPQDVEWAVADGRVWILQARPITAAPPPRPTAGPASGPAVLTGTPGSHGLATGLARVVHGPDDVARVRPGDVLVCRWTDPGWTPLLGIAAGVVTETGGVLSHAAIVARERRIPAVLAVADAMTAIRDGDTITVDGTSGIVTVRG